MHRRNSLLLAAVLGGSVLVMIATRLLLYPESSGLGVGGVGITGVVLMFLNRQWLHPSSGPIPRAALLRSALLASLMGVGFALLFGSLG